MAHFIRVADAQILNLDFVFDASWVGSPEQPELQLLIAGASFDPGRKAGGLGPWIVTLSGEEAHTAWRALTAAARPVPAPAPVVTLAPELLDDDVEYETPIPIGTTYRAGEAEVFVDARDPRAEPEVFGPWAGAVPLSRFLEAARAVEAIARDPRFQHTPIFASAAD